MKNRKLQSVILCSLGLLLILSLSAGVVGLSFAGAHIVPAAGMSERAEPVFSLDAELSAAMPGKEMEPTALYDLACRQTVYIRYEKTNAKGDKSTLSGSGIIVSQDGYILTNAHCVSDAREAGDPIEVYLHDGSTFVGEIIGADSDTDVALLKIDARGLPAVSLSTTKLKPCQTIYTMGHPSETLKYTMTSGIVSGLDREVDFSDGAILKMFQFDAAVNPGNSGGPVYNAYGKVVGMVTAKYVAINAEGIGFAIPIDSALEIAGQLKEFGYVTGRPLLGITAISVEAGKLKTGSPEGVMVHDAEAGLSGYRAGLIKGDIIVSVDGKTISSMEDLTRVKRDYKAGDTVRLRFWRDGVFMETYLTFDEVTPEHPVGPVDIEDEEDGPSEWELPPEGDGEDTPDGESEDASGGEEAPADNNEAGENEEEE